jgi:uncharacterized protein
MNKNNIDFIIYHSPRNTFSCPDGSISAFCAYLYLHKLHPTKKIVFANINDKYQDNTIIFYPANYNNIKFPKVTGRNVLLCDISYPKNIINIMIKEASSFMLIDHHETAEQELIDIDQKYKIFDMNHSGAYLTWKYFFPDNDVPLLIKYIQSRDIWTKDMENTDAFSYWFDTIPQNFEEYKKYLDNTVLLDVINNTGLKYQELNKFYINECCMYAVPKFTKINKRFYFVVYVNGTLLKSDIGNKLMNMYPFADFSAVYTINDKTNTTSFSLRSLNNRTNVAQIAKLYGGGGHRNASGLCINKITNILDGVVYDNSGKLYESLNNIYTDTILFNKNLNSNETITLKAGYIYADNYKPELGMYIINNDNSLDMSIVVNYYKKTTNFYITFADHIDINTVLSFYSKYNVKKGYIILNGIHKKIVYLL